MEMREIYARTLVELAASDDRVVVLEADLMKATGTGIFKEKYPDRLFNVGVAEADMVGIASGLSAAGKIPFAASFGCFATRRAFDQFFLSGNYARQNVKLVGTDPGITAAYNGGTHMPFEDVGITRVIPNCIIFEPCDGVSLKKLIIKNVRHYGCSYMRLHRKEVADIYPENEEFELGKGKVLTDGSDVTIIAMGAVMVPEALAAAAELKKYGISAAVIDMHTVKPIDRNLVVTYARKTGAVVTCENHNIVNGLGSAVAEVLSEECPVRMKRVGVKDSFGEVGTIRELQKHFGLDSEHIIEAVKCLLHN